MMWQIHGEINGIVARNGHPLVRKKAPGLAQTAPQNELGSVGEYMWAGIFNTRFWIDSKDKLAIVSFGQRIPRAPEIEAKERGPVYLAIER